MEKFDFGNKLYEYRTQKGLTQKELGKLLGVTDKAVSKWETGESKPRLDKMTQITELFETSIDGMLGKETADGEHEHLKPYKTIFDLRLKKYDKYYKAGRIWTYIIAIICVVALAGDIVSEMLVGGFAVGRIGSLIGTIILASATVIFTSVFKPRFNECKSKDMNIFMAFIFAVFLLVSAYSLISAVKIGKVTGKYDKVAIGLICAEALILTVIAIISSLKKRYIVFVIFILGFSVGNLFKFELDYYLTIFAIIFQFTCFIKKRNWLSLAEKAELEIKRQIKGKKITKVFVTVVLIITVLSIALSSFSPYITYKILLNKVYPENDRIKRVEYDYSAEFKEGEYYEYSFKGASFKIPNGFEITDESDPDDGIVYFKNENNSVISVDYFEDDYNQMYSDLDSATEEDKKMLYMNSVYKRYFGVPILTIYGMDYYNYAVDVTDVKFYETKKAALLLMPLFTQSFLRQTSPVDRAAVYNNGEYCGFVSCTSLIKDGKPSSIKYRLADVWHVYDLEGAYYHIMYMDRDGNDEEAHQMICKIVNSLEF